jgi:hypothetical protein
MWENTISELYDSLAHLSFMAGEEVFGNELPGALATVRPPVISHGMVVERGRKQKQRVSFSNHQIATAQPSVGSRHP